MGTSKAFLGGRLRQLREGQGLTQAALAQLLGLSPSYLNQLERNQRPLTAQVMARLNAALGTDVQPFSAEGDTRLLAELREAFVGDPTVGAASLADLVATSPAIAQRIVALHRAAREAEDRATALAIGHGADLPPPTAYEEVRDFIYDHRNYFPTLDAQAERLSLDSTLPDPLSSRGLAERLHTRHAITLRRLKGAPALRQFDRESRVLTLLANLTEGQIAFQLATQIALIEAANAIDEVLAGTRFSGGTARALARIGLAHYYAGAVLMPYGAFRRMAEDEGYDIDRLGRAFGTGFEATCHRLSTLQRPDARGVPFFFLRVDRAGNISKRQSATDFHFSKIGGSCPLWRVHAAFDHPGEILTQIAEMPDGRRYFWVTRTVISPSRQYGAIRKTFALAIGCDVAHAGRLVYARGLDLSSHDPAVVTPIGPACKTCVRENCPQRAFPMVARPLAVDPDATRFAPYSASPAG